jgi:protein TonB
MRSSWVLVSIVSHSVAITAAAIAPLVASVDLPEVHSPLPAYIAVVAHDIPLPPPPATGPTRHSAVDQTSVPFEAPPGIGSEPAQKQLDDQRIAGGFEEGGPGLVQLGPIGQVVAPPLPPTEHPPVRVSDGVRIPRKIVDVAPVYPVIAINARKSGVVILEAVIDTRGYVKDVHVLRSIPLLDDAAIDAVRQWRYTPTLLNGQPVSVIMTVTVKFTLDK